MQQGLTIIDKFFPDPDDVRSFMLEHDFTKPASHNGFEYSGFIQIQDARFLSYLAAVFNNATGLSIRIEGAAVVGGTEKNRTVQWIHADTTCASYAGVIYMFEGQQYGTAFWQHAETGAETVNEYASLHRDPATLIKEGNEENLWKRTDYADSKYNRMIFFPSDRFHSRWPEAGFGDKPANCRLTISFFFDIL